VTDLEQEYSPSSRVGGDAGPFVAHYVARSAVVREELGTRLVTLPGGTLAVSAGTGAPVLVFIHGGYWQALSAEASLFLAPGAMALGWSYAAVEYTIAPAGDLPTMVRQCTTALTEVVAALGGGPLVLAGHSAGAHLAAMVSVAACAPVPVARTVLVSGVYDLRPIVHTTVNEPLELDSRTAAGLSPVLLPVVGEQDVVVAWGDNETDAFKAQGTAYSAWLRAGGLRVATLECAGRHHFDIVDDLVDPASDLGRFTVHAFSGDGPT
jgi:arylformamidase